MVCHSGGKEGNGIFNDALNTFIYSYMASDISVKDHGIAGEETRCRHMGYSFRIAARVLLYAPSHIQISILRPLLC